MKKKHLYFAPLKGFGRILLRWYVLSSFSGKRTDSPVSRTNARITLGLEEWIARGGFLSSDAGLEETAAEIGVDADQLSEYCLAIIGKPFRSWRKELRIREAKRILLEQPQMSLREVGDRVGICDKSDFRRQFAEICGCTPSEWRKKMEK